ncbi:hypothetical protein [Streptococcus gallolyticus]|uniref:hypothetical protein n=1 Tax=Streptococcus gallolyticus TaxID=315405 RepID=UPI002283E648|nr:hypothetical protein [Streptococcus gallolyticus]MCY7186356.1 hypothetical protein [Streptococcus gallolyticus subsp. gallolyticus]MCY7190559.1 hypothetical protein [Streptococcus gallolyticus subsp. gallolyticus]
MSKILVPKTDYLVEINELIRTISIIGNPKWEISASFEAKENQATLDENGDLFEPIYRLNLRAIPKFNLELETSSQAKDLKKELAEIQALFEFIEENKRNFFNMFEFKGVLE